MPKKWSKREEQQQLNLLRELYIEKNLTIFQVAKKLNIAYQTVYDRLKRVGIKTIPYLKPNYTNKKILKCIPYSKELSEFIGIMCGDGHISDEQVFVFLGNKSDDYGRYIIDLFRKLFDNDLKVVKRDKKYLILYLGFRELSRFLMDMGLVKNKVKEQVRVPKWILTDKDFMRVFIRGFFDTDGSIYKLRWGAQISFCNRSVQLLKDARKMLSLLGFHPSKISVCHLYLTQKSDLKRFLDEIGSNNTIKFNKLKNWVGTEVDKPGAL